MADTPNKPSDYPNFATTPFGIGTMYTRQGRGLMQDDLPVYLSPKQGETKHARGGKVNRFAEGGPVLSRSGAPHGKQRRW